MRRLLSWFLFLGLTPVHGQTPGVPATNKTIEVRDSATGEAIAGASVTLKMVSVSGSTTTRNETGPDGRVTFDTSGQTKLDLSIEAPGYQTLTKSWDASSEEPIFRLTRDAQANAQPVVPGDSTAGPPTDNAAAAAGAQPAPGWMGLLRAIATSLAFALAPVLAYFGLREVVVRTMAFLMMRRGSKATPTEPAPAPSGPLNLPPTVEFLEMNTLNGVLLNGPAQDRLERAESTGRRKLKILALSFLAKVLGLGIALALVAWRFPAVLDDAAGGAAALVAVDAVLLFYSLTTYLQGARIIEIIGLGASVLSTAAAALAIYFKVPFYLALIPAIAQVSVLVTGLRRIRGAARQDGNRKIVILRVFGSDKNAAFTFGNLMSRWRFVGSYLSIADPAFIRYRFSVFSRANAATSVGTTLTLGTGMLLVNLAVNFLAQLPPGTLPGSLSTLIPASWSTLSDDERKLRIQGVAFVVMAVLACIPTVFYLWRRFLKAPEQAVKQVERVEHAKLGVESDYHGSALFCFDDVWKPAVHKMLAVADVVLMDLRGFSAERQGCAYEIGELMNGYPVDRLLFLVDKKTSRELLYGLIRERWSTMSAESPNRKLTDPVIKIYETGDRNRRDTSRIAALLSASLEGRVQVVDKQLAQFA